MAKDNHKCDTNGTITISSQFQKNWEIQTATFHCSHCGLPTKTNVDRIPIATDYK